MTHESESADEAAADAATTATVQWWQLVATAAASLRALAHAQGALAKAEWRLSRSLVGPLLLLALVAVVLAVALGLTVLTLAAMVLFAWLESWVLALLVLAGMLALLLGLALHLLQRCARRMSLPRTRAQWQQTAREFKTAAQVPQASAVSAVEDCDDAVAQKSE